MRNLLFFFAITGFIFGQTNPTIRNITNAAIPSLDSPAAATVHLAARSLATIFGSGLADVTAAATSTPPPTALGGTEVHFAADSCSDISCDLIAQLIYVSDAQINIVVPENGLSTPVPYRVVFIRDGKRIDQASVRLIIDQTETNLVFETGSACLFSFSSSDPTFCSQHQGPTGAIFDAISGQPITASLPIHQGQLLTLWLTAISGGVKLDALTGLLEEANPIPLSLGIAQEGADFPATVATGPNGGFKTPLPLFAGESAQFVGLDQVNVAFPTCTNVGMASTEKRYDAFLPYRNATTGNTTRIYMPFIVRVGDPDCTWPTNNTLSISSTSNPSVSGSSVTFTAKVSASDATGTVTIMDGGTVLSDVSVINGTATYSPSPLSVGSHTIVFLYNGDVNYSGSEATLTQVVNAATRTVISSSLNPSFLGQAVTFAASVSTTDLGQANGSVTFYDGSTMLGTIGLAPAVKPVTGSVAYLTTSVLGIGAHQITASYVPDAGYAGSASQILAQTVTAVAPKLSITYAPASPVVGQTVAVTVGYDPTATGTVTLFDGTTKIGTTALVNGTTVFSINSIGGGTHVLTANYSGDSKFSATFASSSMVVAKAPVSVAVTSSANPTTYQPHGNGCTPASPSCVTYTVYLTLTAFVTSSTGINFTAPPTGPVNFYADSLLIECNQGRPIEVGGTGSAVCPVTGNLPSGTPKITAVYLGDTNFSGSTSPSIPQVVNMDLYAFPNPAAKGQAVSFEVVTGWPYDQFGVVTLYEGNSAIGSGIVSPVTNTLSSLNGNNVATITPTVPLVTGNHSLYAVYTPTPGNVVATSQIITEIIP